MKNRWSKLRRAVLEARKKCWVRTPRSCFGSSDHSPCLVGHQMHIYNWWIGKSRSQVARRTRISWTTPTRREVAQWWYLKSIIHANNRVLNTNPTLPHNKQGQSSWFSFGAPTFSNSFLLWSMKVLSFSSPTRGWYKDSQKATKNGNPIKGTLWVYGRTGWTLVKVTSFMSNREKCFQPKREAPTLRETPQP